MHRNLLDTLAAERIVQLSMTDTFVFRFVWNDNTFCLKMNAKIVANAGF